MSLSDRFPRGTVVFLFTDIEGSTALWEQQRLLMRTAVDRHIELLGQAIAGHHGVHFKTVGDALQAAFHTAPDALAAATTGQRLIHQESWPPEIGALRVRMALHAGVAHPDEGDYLAPALNRLARMLNAGHGGQILVSHAVRTLLAGDLPPDIVMRSLGTHALRDLNEPEELFQVVVPGLPDTFPPLRSLPHHPTNLVVPPTSLIGREKERAEVVALLRKGVSRLVTLTGPGGSGKTRLAFEVAADLLGDFPDGVFAVDLSTLHDPTVVENAVATVLGVRETPRQSLRDSIAQYLASRRVLLLLDNCEHLIEAAATLATLLVECPALSVLVTSREPLRIRAEREYPVDPFVLPPDGAALSLAEIARLPAVVLFVERARASNPGFALAAENAADVLAICRALDGLPLAIELAAARTRLLPPHALLPRLERRLPLLTGGARDLPARQRTLRDTIAWSHNLLDDPERSLFQRLAVFSGGWTLDAAEAVTNLAGDLDVFSGVARLAEQNLIRVDERETEPRYTMLGTIREFAAEQLAASGEEARQLEAHASYFQALAEKVRDSPFIRAEIDRDWLARLERDHDNLREALAWRVQSNDVRGAFRLGAAAGTFWSWSNHWAVGRAYLMRVLALGLSGDPVDVARVITYAGSFAFSQGDARAALAILEPGLALARTPETEPWIYRIHLKLAQAFGQLRDFTRAMDHYECALDLVSRMDDREPALEVRWSMAYTATSRGDLERATRIAESVLADERERGHPLVVAGALELLVWIALAEGDLDKAASRLHSAREAVENAPSWAEGLRVNLAMDESILAYRRGNDERALALAAEMLPLARATRSRQDLLFALLLLASLGAHRGHHQAAARLFGALHAAIETGEHALHLEPAVRPWHEADVARVRESLGAVEFDRAWTAGNALSLDAALDEAERLLLDQPAATPA